jgi:hypothetical protein
VCAACHASCHTCSGPTDKECTGCLPQMKLHNGGCKLDNKQEFFVCADGYTLAGSYKCIKNEIAQSSCELEKL